MALLQMFVEFKREANLAKAACMIKEAASNGAKVLALPVSKSSRRPNCTVQKYRPTILFFCCLLPLLLPL